MQLEKLELTRRFLERLDHRVIRQNDDRVIVVLGDEGIGKSTFMLELARIWRDVRDSSTDPDDVLDSMVWGDRSDFISALRERDPGSLIAVQDAAHTLFKREAMRGEQIDVEKKLLDIRIKNYLIVLGYQDWGDVPTSLQRRRAENVLYLPRTGVVHGYNRRSVDEREDSGEWPDPDFEDRFPDLEGTELWSRFSERDREAKLDRLDDIDEPEPEDIQRQQQIKTSIRAVKPWSDDEGMTLREAAKLVDYSKSWVGDRVREWKDGKHRDLLGQNEESDQPTARA